MTRLQVMVGAIDHHVTVPMSRISPKVIFRVGEGMTLLKRVQGRQATQVGIHLART